MLPLLYSRTIGVMAHVDAGKTTVSERMLVCAGRLHRAGNIDHGDTHLDTTFEEVDRGITISAAATSFEWSPRVGLGAGVRHVVQLVDTPGHVDFGIEVERSLSVLDGAVLVLDASKGVEPQTEAVWRQAERHGVPRIGFINKMDKPGADWGACLSSIHERLGVRPIPVVWPIGAWNDFVGVVDLRTGGATFFDARPAEGCPRRDDITKAQLDLIEALADYDDEVMVAYVADVVPPVEAFDRAIRKAVLARALLPVLPGAALRDKGVPPLLDAIAQWLPSPLDRPPFVATIDGAPTTICPDPDGPLAALVFKSVGDPHLGPLAWTRVLRGRLVRKDVVEHDGKRRRVGRLLRLDGKRLDDVEVALVGDIVAVAGIQEPRTGGSLCAPDHVVTFPGLVVPEPVVEVVVEAASQVDQDRLNETLRRYASEDPSLRLGSDPETGQVTLRGQGELHLDVVLSRARRELGIQLRTSQPRVAWRETPAGSIRLVYRHIRQNGGAGVFAVVDLSVAPGAPGSGITFVNEVTGGALSTPYVAAVEKGARQACGFGLHAPVTDVVVTLHDGETHVKDSSAMAFEQAGSLAFREALQQAGVTLLEPVVSVSVVVSETTTGSVLGDLVGRGATIQSMQARAIEALVPLRRMFGYATVLRGLTQGRGSFAMAPAGYVPAPSGVR